jgi:hypothetical protein
MFLLAGCDEKSEKWASANRRGGRIAQRLLTRNVARTFIFFEALHIFIRNQRHIEKFK